MTSAESARHDLLLFDTHALVWRVLSDNRLGKRADQAIRMASRERRLLVSAITPWEIALLVSKRRIDLHRDVLDWIRDALAMPGVRLVGFEPEIAVASTRLPWEMHPDPADRILVATARHLGATLVTADTALLGMARKGSFKAMDAES
jgi:PIN domain nuclease of toxin-antitoxin system